MTLDPISIATMGYVCGDCPDPIAIATLGYVCPGVVDVGLDGSGSSQRSRHLLSLEELRRQEDDEVIALLAIVAEEL